MKELWSILMEKLKLVEPIEALIMIGITGMFAIGMSTVILVKFFSMIVAIVSGVGGTPHHV
jgi:hypothetical protein